MLTNQKEKVLDTIENPLLLEKAGTKIILKDSHENPLEGEILQEWNYLIVKLENVNSESLTIDFAFHEKKQEEPLTISFSILPSARVTIPIPLTLLDSQELFPPRTVGRLRMMVTGKPIQKGEVTKVVLSTRKFYCQRELIIVSIKLSNQKEEEIHHPEILMDEWGQWNQKEWDSKITSKLELERTLNQLLKEAEEFDDSLAKGKGNYYGAGEKISKGSGWFQTEKVDGKWLLITPDGYPFFSVGIDGINPGTETGFEFVEPYIGNLKNQLDEEAKGNLSLNFGIQNLIEVFFKDDWWDAWFKITRMYIHKWRMNTIGNWSSLDFIEKARMPYVLPLDSVGENPFPSTEMKIFRDFPDVFSEEYQAQSEAYSQNLVPFREDPFLIGYFMRNEPAWGFVYDLNIAEEMLANEKESCSKNKFIREMKQKYVSIEAFNESWKTIFADFNDLQMPLQNASKQTKAAEEDLKDFSKKMIEQYVAIPAEACRRVDDHHLNLGMRYAYVADPMMLSGAHHFDVFSINSYQLSPKEKIEEIAAVIDKPVMIGEFHFGSIDKGLTATGIRGVRNQKERGIAYRYYMEQAASHPAFVGAHYFMLNDQSCLGRFDGENYQIGLIDICMQEYSAMTQIVEETNVHLYPIHMDKRRATTQMPKEIPPIFC